MTAEPERDPLFEDEPAEDVYDPPTYPEDAPSCTRCGNRNPNTLERGRDGICGLCLDVEALRANPPQKSIRPIGEDVDVAKWGAAMAAAQVHPCVGGCGEKLSRPGELCGACYARRQEEHRRTTAMEQTRLAMPRRWQWARFDAPEMAARVKDKSAVDKVREACRDHDVFVLSGAVGSGKTSLAVAIVRAVAERDSVVGAYVTARDLSRARSQTKLGAESSVVSEAIDAGVLLVDDIGLDDAQQFGSALLDVVFARHANGLPTVVTLACKPDELAERYGLGFARRLIEDDGANFLIEVRRFGVVRGGGK